MHHNLIFLLLCIFTVNCSGSTDCRKQPEQHTFMSCCNYPKEIQEAINKCDKKFPPKENSLGLCFDQCVLTELQFFGNGTFAMAGSNATLANLFNNTSSDMLPISIKYFNKCVEHANTTLAGFKVTGKPDPNQCSPHPLFFFSCFFNNIFINCPNSMWNSTAACQHSHDYFADCVVGDRNKE